MRYLWLVFCILLCLGVGFTAGQFTDTESDWFIDLEKPSFYPPGYLFGLVWTILYFMMGVSLYLIVEKTKERLPYILFGVQLVLNFFWTFIFFAWKQIFFALIEIMILWAILVWTMIVFRKYSRWAYYLLMPYILWVTFAAILTFSIYLIN